MKRQSWFQKDLGPSSLRNVPQRTALAADRAGFTAKLRPHELIAMLTHHYARARARALPKVRTTIAVQGPDGKPAVTIGWG